MEKIVVVGCGGHGRVIISILKKLEQFELVGYVDREDKGNVLGIPFLGTDEDLEKVRDGNQVTNAAIGLGSTKITTKREDLYEQLKEMGFAFPLIVSPYSVVDETVSLGEGSVVMPGAIINVGTTSGVCSIFNTGSCTDHDCLVSDFVHIAPGAVLCGGVEVGENSLIGAGATVVQYKNVGSRCLIGAGSTVVNDCLESGVYKGKPAKLVRELP